MTRFIQEGKILDFLNATETKISYRDVIVSGGKVFIATEDIQPGATGGILTQGVFEVNAVTGTAFAVGDDLYWDSVEKRVTKTTTNNTLMGYAASPKASASNLALVKLKC